MKILFLPGLAADHRLFQYQLESFPEARVPQWLAPKENESLSQYAQRWSEHFAMEKNLTLVGMSFGGQVALEMAKHLNVKKVLLVSSHRNSSEISSTFRIQQKMSQLLSDQILRASLKKVGVTMMQNKEKLKQQEVTWLEEMVDSMDVPFFRWAAKAVADWQYEYKPQELRCEMRQIHGELDDIIPIPKYEDVYFLPKAKHLLNYTHAKEVNEWIQKNILH
jgi:pimeloyl-ACP methyl ester carboxylesterase